MVLHYFREIPKSEDSKTTNASCYGFTDEKIMNFKSRLQGGSRPFNFMKMKYCNNAYDLFIAWSYGLWDGIKGEDVIQYSERVQKLFRHPFSNSCVANCLISVGYDYL